MQRLLQLTIFLILSTVTYSQLYVGGSIGVAAYDGDLNASAFKRMKPAVSAIASYELTNRFNARVGFLLGSLEGGDQWSGTTLLKQIRNLSFKTEITELSLVGELQAFNLNKKNWTPYIFGGVALFHFNPYVIGDSSKKIFLKPLSTEGQGLSEYPNREPYALTQLSFPFGGGIKVVASDNIIVGLELGLRRTLTDYLDDVSTDYIDENTLFQKKGILAVRYAYRGDEVLGQVPGYPDNGFPANGTQRGGAKYKDWYYVGGVHVVFRLPYGFGKRDESKKKTYGCVTSPM